MLPADLQKAVGDELSTIMEISRNAPLHRARLRIKRLFGFTMP
jgi:hypothetical protein